MDRIQKFLRQLSPKPRRQVIEAIGAIAQNRLEGMDVKPLKGKKNWFRCRLGNTRIVFVRSRPGTNIVIEAEFRGKAYRRL